MNDLTDIEALVRDKDVALVGNSRNVIGNHYPVDNHQIVIRMNYAWRMTEEVKRSVGSRIDILCVSGPNRKHIQNLLRSIPYIIYMTPRHRDDVADDIAKLIYFYPMEWWRPLQDKLGTRPSTGCMAVDMLSRMIRNGHLTLYGFDFFQTSSWHTQLSLKKRIKLLLGMKVRIHPHQGNLEEDFIRQSLPPSQLTINVPTPIDMHNS